MVLNKRIKKTIYHPTEKRRVEIYRREDGTYGFEEWHFSEHETERCWIPTGRRFVTIAETLEIAENEARARIDWLIDGLEQRDTR